MFRTFTPLNIFYRVVVCFHHINQCFVHSKTKIKNVLTLTLEICCLDLGGTAGLEQNLQKYVVMFKAE